MTRHAITAPSDADAHQTNAIIAEFGAPVMIFQIIERYDRYLSSLTALFHARFHLQGRDIARDCRRAVTTRDQKRCLR